MKFSLSNFRLRFFHDSIDTSSASSSSTTKAATATTGDTKVDYSLPSSAQQRISHSRNPNDDTFEPPTDRKYVCMLLHPCHFFSSFVGTAPMSSMLG
jgi:hypothetical protein